jgi:DNA-binding transcriptional MocR family regulator
VSVSRAVTPAVVFVTAGNWRALDLALAMFASRGDAVLVESPTYSLDLGTMCGRHAGIVPVGGGVDGPDVEALEHEL